jgi:YccS/YhfK family integral membrane protein
MSSKTVRQSLRRLWAQDKFSYSVRVFIALTGSMAFCWYQNEMKLLIPLFLGIIASALSETDDSWQGRLNALLVTLVCFTAAATTVELLFPYPLLMVCALALASFGLTMLGALGERYGAIASATLILAVYTMIGVDQRGGEVTDFWHEPLLLVAGAAWYGVLSVLWQALFSNQPVQQSLARLFWELGLYLKLKSSLFEPIRTLDVEAGRLELARQNGKVVAALNTAKEIILHRVGNSRPGSTLSRYLKLYFLAQDIHERASSSHYPYNALADAFFHSDVMFRCQRLLRQQGVACQRLSESIKLRQAFVYDDSFAEALGDLHASLEHLRIQSNPAWRGLLRSLRALAANLGTLDRLLSDASNPDTWRTPPTAACWTARRATSRMCGRVCARTDAHVADLSSRPAPAVGTVHRLCHGALDSPDPRLLDHPDHIVCVLAQLRGYAAQVQPAHHRHGHRPGGGLGAVRSVPQPADPVDVCGGGRGGVLY